MNRHYNFLSTVGSIPFDGQGMYVCMYICMHSYVSSSYRWISECMYVCMYVCMHACAVMYKAISVCMHVCMCVILVGAVKVNQDIKGQYADGDYPRTQVSSLMYVCMYDVCMYVCTVCMYCMNVCMYFGYLISRLISVRIKGPAK